MGANRSGLRGNVNTFNNEFDLINRNLDEIIIKENSAETNCFIWGKVEDNIIYDSFLLSKNTRSKIICEVSFHKSTNTGLYIVRPTFKRLSVGGDLRVSKSEDKVIIKFDNSELASRFWEFIGFLNSFEKLVEANDFEKKFQIAPKESFFLEFKNKLEKEKLTDLKELVDESDLSYSQLKEITFTKRKKSLEKFFMLITNSEWRDGYSEHHKIRNGEEYIWHHFLKANDWILGLTSDLIFIDDILEEQSIGNPSSTNRGNPVVDLIGLSQFTTLIELKHSETPIFKERKSKGRANTWDFSNDFVEAISQCLGQKEELIKNFESKNFVDSSGIRVRKDFIQTVDPKALLIIGNKFKEFPINNLEDENFVKNNVLQRFRRNNRNLDIITYDELFERAYRILYSIKLEDSWQNSDIKVLFD